MSLQKIQSELKAPKSQFNSFGKYNYRNLEDILEALKPILAKYEYSLVISDRIIEVSGRVYVEATAQLMAPDLSIIATATASAREAETKKGMDDSQITGATSSYARKYCLNGMFAIDDTKDADHGNMGKDAGSDKPISEAQYNELHSLTTENGFTEAEIAAMGSWIKKTFGVSDIANLPMTAFAQVKVAIQSKIKQKAAK